MRLIGQTALLRELETAMAAIERVRALHERVTDHYADRPDIAVCSHCTSGGDPYWYPEGAEEWPCPTIRALEATRG